MGSKTGLGWVANPAQKEVAEFIISGGTLSESVTDHTVLRILPTHPRTPSILRWKTAGSLEAQTSSREAELGSHFKKDSPATIIKI